MIYEIKQNIEKSKKFEISVLSQKTKKESHFKDRLEVRVSGKRPFRELMAFIYLCLFYRRNLVLCSLWYPEALIAMLAGKKYIIFTHGAELIKLNQNSFLGKIREKVKRLVLNRAILIIANSEFTKSISLKNRKIKNVIALPLAVDAMKFVPVEKKIAQKKWDTTNKFTLLTLSRIEEHKGHALVFEAINNLPIEYRKRIEYLIGGTGTYSKKLKNISNQLDVASQIRWLGFVSEEDINSLYSAVDIFILFSIELFEKRKVEGFGLVLLEAQSCGTPVIANNSGGMSSAVENGKGGFLIPKDDINELSKLIKKLIDNKAILVEQKVIARKHVINNASWNLYTKRLIKIIDPFFN